MSDINNRKKQHIDIINNDSETDRKQYYFDQIKLIHRALPEIDLEQVDTSIEFMGKSLSFPLVISSMTGGVDSDLFTINKNLAIAAESTGVAMAVGSQRIMFSDPQAKQSFELREFAPNALLFSNLGAVQLNYDFGIEHCQKAVDCLNADALYLHLNPLQEAIQPEGDTNFSKLSKKIQLVAEQLNVPIVIKEVGAGISKYDAEILASIGIKYLDLAGSGGTSWSRIEHFRKDPSSDCDLGLLFQDWGIPTPQAIQDVLALNLGFNLIASGGIRSGIDIAKSIALGAELAGMAQPFLKPAMESPEAVIEVINKIKKEFQLAMFLLGQKKVSGLSKELILYNN